MTKIDIYQKCARDVYLIHQTIRNSTKQLINHLENKGNTPEVLKYAIFWYDNLHFHHVHEDTIVFPLMEQYKRNCDRFKSDHIVLNNLLAKIHSDQKNASIDVEDVKKVDKLMEEHLRAEEADWAALNGVVPEKVLSKMLVKLHKTAQKDMPPSQGLMFLLYHLNSEERKEFIYNDGGKVLEKILVPYVFNRKHGKFFHEYAAYDSYK